ncbi:hypothetical protein [Novosphingobium sp.]|uniref:hypothetical protein n=1 Tax=Novosphingobium sp. TaxID=1874826 RepID=UPI003B52BC74
MLSVNRVATIAACEEHLGSIERGTDGRLLLASNLKYAHCGGAASLLQVINTWSRSVAETDSVLLTHAQAPYAEQTIANLVETLPGLVSVLMSAQVVARDGQTSMLATAYENARQRIEAMDAGRFRDTARGTATTLLCADQTTKRALQPLYHTTANGGAHVRGESDFVDLARDLMAAALGDARKHDFDFKDVEAVGVMLRELFANTHYHARTDAAGRPYRRSVRGVHFAQHALEGDEKVSGGFPPFEEYLASVIARPRRAARAKLLEISVFDSGPGYAARMAGRPIDENVTLEREYEFVRNCLLRNVSTRTQDGAGIGLPRMLSRLKGRGGFVRLRTGRLSLFRSFAGEDDTALVDADYDLEDAGAAAVGFTRHAPAAGSVVTLLFPIGR